MALDRGAYRGILKATSIFGGVQVFQIIIQIIRSKFVAVLLGPAGIGIAGLLSSTIGLVTSLTNFGLGTSAVKNVAEANGSGDVTKVSKTVTIIRKWVWLTGLLGAILTLVFASWLSELTFNSSNYTYAFVWLSITLLLNQMSIGQRVVLQGMRKVKLLAKANMLGSFLGLIVTVPLYYFYGIDGIVPVMIIGSVVSLTISFFYSRKIELVKVHVTQTEIIDTGKELLSMGFMISLSGLLTSGASYILRIYITDIGGVEDVGLYSAGFAIIGTYVGLVFAAMGTDYYPRLSAVSKNNLESKKTVNQQAEISLLILGPILIAFIVFIKFVVILLYSSKFIGITSMIQWAAVGMFFKAASWSIGYLILANGDGKLFFWSELITNTYLLIFNVIGYRYYGIPGLGVSFLLGYLVLLFQVYLITSIKYKFSFEIEFVKIFLFQFVLALLVFTLYFFVSEVNLYFLGSILLIISSYYSFVELNKRIDIKSLTNKILKK